MRAILALSLAAACAAAPGCARKSPGATIADSAPSPLDRLRTFEQSRRQGARFRAPPPQDKEFGADPYDIVSLDDDRFAGVLRGADALVLVDRSLREVARTKTPRSPSALAIYHGARIGSLEPGDLLVASEIEPKLAGYHVRGDRFEELGNIDLGDVYGARDVATGPEGVVYVVEEHDDRLLTLHWSASPSEPPARRSRRVARGPIRVVRTPRALFVLGLLDHSITAYHVDAHGDVVDDGTVVEIDGPFWGLDAIESSSGPGRDAGDVLVLAGGVEDHPLDRSGGFFGYVDSFLYGYRWRAATGALERTFAINVGEAGLIVPKALAFDRRPSKLGPEALVTSYGGATALRLVWDVGVDGPPSVRPFASVPGASASARVGAGFVLADPLLDAWAFVGPDDRTRVVHVAASPANGERTEQERLGEALFFTGLMAPHASAEGAKSRFSCETCHFEGYVDGRTHHTGRGDILATTKPLVGLFNNRPHFSRALDPDLSAVAENEFRVAGAPSPVDPHFDLDPSEVPWLAELGIEPRRYDATELRLALMSFLMRWTHRTNPRSSAGRRYTDDERRGAIAFAERCEGCHQARTVADDPSSRITEGRWEILLGSKNPIVWASDAYEKTGIEPYVHERGARVPSLRSSYKKRPYFTNGSAPDMMTVLRRARFSATGFRHDGAGDAATAEALDEPTARAIAAFLDRL